MSNNIFSNNIIPTSTKQTNKKNSYFTRLLENLTSTKINLLFPQYNVSETMVTFIKDLKKKIYLSTTIQIEMEFNGNNSKE